jgi:dihydroorotate dehydrogenase
MASKLARLRGELGMKFTIVGVGGAGSAEAFDEYRRAGADVVMTATAAMWHPELAKEIKGHAHEL